MIAISRFTVGEEQADQFAAQAEVASAVLAAADGFLSIDIARNLDEPTLWTITTRWKNVGSYRRAIGSYQAKLAVVPLLSMAIDEPSAYEGPEATRL